MKATSLPNLNRESTTYHNFFTFFQDPNHHDDTNLHERPNIDHSQVSEPSETSPFKDILSPFVSFNESNKNHYPVGGFFWERDQKDQTLPRRPPSPARSSEMTVSVGSNPFSGSVGARSEGPNVTQLQGDQTQPSMSSVGSYQSSSNVGARSAGLIFSQSKLPRDKRRVTTQTWTTTASDLDDGFSWGKYAQKYILDAKHPRNYFRCAHKFDQGCQATKQVQKTDEDPPMYQTTYYGNHTCRNPPAHPILDSTIPKNNDTYTPFPITPPNSPSHMWWDPSNDSSNKNTPFVPLLTAYSPAWDVVATCEPHIDPTSDEDPPMYQTTYRGNHTCRNPPASHPILDSTIPNDSSNSNFISFGPTNYPLPINQSTPIQWSDSMVFESSSWAMPALPSGSDPSDTNYSSGAHSCTPGAHDNSFDDLEELVDFDVSQQLVEFCY